MIEERLLENWGLHKSVRCLQRSPMGPPNIWQKFGNWPRPDTARHSAIKRADSWGAGQAVVTLHNTYGDTGGLTISDPPTQAVVQALRDKCEGLSDDVHNLSTPIHSLRTALVVERLIKGAD